MECRFRWAVLRLDAMFLMLMAAPCSTELRSASLRAGRSARLSRRGSVQVNYKILAAMSSSSAVCQGVSLATLHCLARKQTGVQLVLNRSRPVGGTAAGVLPREQMKPRRSGSPIWRCSPPGASRWCSRPMGCGSRISPSRRRFASLAGLGARSSGRSPKRLRLSWTDVGGRNRIDAQVLGLIRMGR